MKARRARRHEVVAVIPDQISQQASIKIPRIEKSRENYALIKHALDDNILFNDCSPEQIDLIILAMKPRKVPKNFRIIKEGGEGFNFFVIRKGKFKFSKKGKTLGECKGGDCFGELALLFGAPRAATVTSLESAEVWKLDRYTFRRILDSSDKIKQHRVRIALSRSPLFTDFDEDKLEQLAGQAHYQSFRKGDVVINKGDEGKIFYIVVAGQVQVTKAGEDMNDTVFGSGDYFGERALMTNEPRNANVIAIEETDLIAIDRQTFEKFLGSKMQLLDQNLGLRVLKSIELLQDLTNEQFEELWDNISTETYKQGKVVFKQGDIGKNFYIIKSGNVDIVRQENGKEIHISTLKTGSHFGEMALLDNEPRAASATCTTQCTFFTVGRDRFETLFGPLKSMEHKKELRKKQLKKASLKSSGADTSGMKDEIKYADLVMLSILGTGTFGVVKLVQHATSSETYALKILQKQQIVQYQQQENVMNEKNILMQSTHPFILRLFATYQDKNRLYMLLELVQGGELFTLLHNSENKRLPDDHARFYAACVVDALHYLHDLSIVYRDLKPENLMIDTHGYIKVVDFGFAKKVTSQTFTLCGTPEYLAPELVLQKGHNRAVDYWAIGVLIYEMIRGHSPFADLARNEQITVCRNIVRRKYSFSKSFPPAARDIVNRLLQKNPHERLGMNSDAGEIKKHPWFKKTDFETLRAKKLSTPWKPDVSDNTDVSFFDEYEEEIQELEYSGNDQSWADKF